MLDYIHIIQHMRAPEYFGGYIREDNKYTLMFNLDHGSLLEILAKYTEKGTAFRFYTKEKEEELLGYVPDTNEASAKAHFATIWRYQTASPFAFGRQVRPMSTRINLLDYHTYELLHGFQVVSIPSGKAKGVYELESGGLVGDTISDVNSDIAACRDIEFMKHQITEAAQIGNSAYFVTNEEFGLPAKVQDKTKTSGEQEYRPDIKTTSAVPFSNSAMEKY